MSSSHLLSPLLFCLQSDTRIVINIFFARKLLRHTPRKNLYQLLSRKFLYNMCYKCLGNFNFCTLKIISLVIFANNALIKRAYFAAQGNCKISEVRKLAKLAYFCFHQGVPIRWILSYYHLIDILYHIFIINSSAFLIP